MTHGLTANQITATESDVVRIAMMVRLDFDSGVVLANNTPSNITHNSETYLGVGTLGSISGVGETSEVSPQKLSLALSGIPSETLSNAFEHYQGRDCQIFLALLDDGFQLIDDPVLVWRGRIDTTKISIQETATITLTAESRLVDWSRPRVRRYTHEDQQDLFAGDLGFEFVAQMVNKMIYWGSQPPT